MKTPICSFDAKTGVLCAKCDERLNSGQITKDDVEAAILLTKVASKSQEVDKFTLNRGAVVESEFVLALRGSDVTTLRSNSALVERIEKEFEQKVWFLDSEASERGFVEGLFHPARVTSVNQFWLPDGNKLTKVILAGRAGQKKIDIEKVQKIAKAVRNIELLVEFEQK